MEHIKTYEVIDEDLAHVFYVGPEKRDAENMKWAIEAVGHKAKVVIQ